MQLVKMTALLLTAASLGTAAAAPLLAFERVAGVSYVNPRQVLYEKHVSASGTIESMQTKQVYLDTPVLADAVTVKVGDYVQKGQILATIDTETTRQILRGREVEATASIAKSVLGSGLTSNELQKLGGLSELITQAGLNLSDESIAAFLPDGVVDASNSGAYIPAVITSPMDGVITQVGLQSDLLFSSGQPAVTVSDNRTFLAKVSVGESNIGLISVGDTATITGAAFPDKSYTGRVSKIYPMAHKSVSGVGGETVVDVEIAIDDADDALKTGFTVMAEISTAERRMMLSVPYTAVSQDDSNQEFVYTIENSAAMRRNVETGLELSDGVEILSGIDISDLIVADASAIKRERQALRLESGGAD